MIRASIPTSYGFSLFVALTLAPTFPALGQAPVILVADVGTISVPIKASAVRTAGKVIGAVLVEAGYHVYSKISDASAGIKIRYAVFNDIRHEIILSRASVRIEASMVMHPGGRHLGRVEQISYTQIRIPENCVGTCLEARLEPTITKIAHRVARGLDIQLRKYSHLSRRGQHPSRDW